MLDWIGTTIGIVGLAPTIAVGVDRARFRIPHRQSLNFTSPQGIEIIVTASATGISGVGPADDESKRALRDLVPAGDLAGVADICTMLSRAYRRRSWVITSSTRVQDDARRDLILVGGPVHNRYTSRMISEDSASTDPIVFDANRRYIRLGAYELGPGIDLEFENNIPGVEYCIVLLSEVRNHGRNQRVVAVGGLTTYGTHAGCHFVATDLPKYIQHEDLGKRPNVCILVKATIVNSQPYDVRPVHHVELKEPGARPSLYAGQ
jgi:hypothetical protein